MSVMGEHTESSGRGLASDILESSSLLGFCLFSETKSFYVSLSDLDLTL